jgi:hypothetical protein
VARGRPSCSPARTTSRASGPLPLAQVLYQLLVAPVAQDLAQDPDGLND